MTAFVRITGERLSDDMQSIVFTGSVFFLDTGSIYAAEFPLPISLVPASGDNATLLALVKSAVSRVTGRIPDFVRITGWYL